VTAAPSLDMARAALATVTDPEIPVLTLDDLGVIRDIAVTEGDVTVTITPTYSGCPAMTAMALDIEVALARAGFGKVSVKQVLSPAWTTDWMTDAGREKLLAYGIAPPAAKASRRALFAEDDPLSCPRCRSHQTTKLSEFGSTSCKSLWRCDACLEPFDAFKCI
jgi:ring-1,2-phenylacetyl-CoA epoxidase subunit PaaD